MGGYSTFITVVLVLVVCILLLPKLLGALIKEKIRKKSRENAAKDPFACPKCGHVFYAEPRQLRGYLRHFGKANLKCPKCGVRSVCSRPYGKL